MDPLLRPRHTFSISINNVHQTHNTKSDVPRILLFAIENKPSTHTTTPYKKRCVCFPISHAPRRQNTPGVTDKAMLPFFTKWEDDGDNRVSSRTEREKKKFHQLSQKHPGFCLSPITSQSTRQDVVAKTASICKAGLQDSYLVLFSTPFVENVSWHGGPHFLQSQFFFFFFCSLSECTVLALLESPRLFDLPSCFLISVLRPANCSKS